MRGELRDLGAQEWRSPEAGMAVWPLSWSRKLQLHINESLRNYRSILRHPGVCPKSRGVGSHLRAEEVHHGQIWLRRGDGWKGVLVKVIRMSLVVLGGRQGRKTRCNVAAWPEKEPNVSPVAGRNWQAVLAMQPRFKLFQLSDVISPYPMDKHVQTAVLEPDLNVIVQMKRWNGQIY